MTERNTLAQAMHDIGLAAWFGGSLMGAIGVNGAAADVDDPRQRAHVANAGWSRWTPFNLVAIGAHLVGGAQLMRANKGRIATQQGVLVNTTTKLALTAGALGATAYARVLSQQLLRAGEVPVAGESDSLAATAPKIARAQQQLSALQWAIPGLTGAMLASSSLRAEQQRPSQVVSGVLKGLPATLGTAAGVTAAVAKHEASRAGAAMTEAALTAKHKVQERVGAL